MSEIKLLPCPFCGGTAKVRGEKFYQPNVRRNVICTKCFSSGGWYKTEEEAIEKWNTREPMQEIVKKLEKELLENPDDYVKDYRSGLCKAIEITWEVGGMNELSKV